MARLTPTQALSRTEFIALMGMLMATVAFSIDAMLPAMGIIAEELSPDDPRRVQLIIPVFVIGLGIGTLFTGTLSDAFGRRPIVLGSAVIYCAGAALAWMAPTLELLLAARLVQGFGASGARVVSLAIVRDCFSGRAMAQVTSMVIMVFTLVPAIAPTIGAGIIWLGGWRSIFASFLAFSVVIVGWFWLRQPETLPHERRRRIRAGELWRTTVEIMGHALVRRAIAVQVMCYAMLFTMISVAQPIFDRVLGAADTFHLWFGAIVFLAIGGPLLNARIVVSLGMHRIVSAVLSLQIAACLLYWAALASGVVSLESLPAFLLWMGVTFAMAGTTLGNLNALALQPVGHVAGTASSLLTAIGTAGGGLLAIPATALFLDSQVPVIGAILTFAVVGRLLLISPVFAAEQPA